MTHYLHIYSNSNNNINSLENDEDDVHLDHDLWPECVDIYRIHQSGVSEERLDWELSKNYRLWRGDFFLTNNSLKL